MKAQTLHVWDAPTYPHMCRLRVNPHQSPTYIYHIKPPTLDQKENFAHKRMGTNQNGHEPTLRNFLPEIPMLCDIAVAEVELQVSFQKGGQTSLGIGGTSRHRVRIRVNSPKRLMTFESAYSYVSANSNVDQSFFFFGFLFWSGDLFDPRGRRMDTVGAKMLDSPKSQSS